MQGSVLYILPQPGSWQSLVITVRHYHQIPLGSTRPQVTAKEETKEDSERARDRDKLGGLKMRENGAVVHSRSYFNRLSPGSICSL